MARKIEVFRPGTFQPMSGPAVTLTADDLKAIAASYDPAVSGAPAVVGHPRTDDPAYGWASSFSFNAATDRLEAEIGDLAPAFEQAVRDKAYRRISLSLFRPTDPHNPKPGAWYPKHIGFLGGAAPAVTGLRPVQLAGADEGVTVEFGDLAFRDVASLFRRMRDWLVEQSGIEKADQVLPDWQISWIDAQDDTEKREFPGFSAAPKTPAVDPHPPQKDTAMTKPDEAAFAAREKALADRETEIAEREAKAAHDGNVSFAETLIADGRLLPALKDKTVALLDAVGQGVAEASFAEGDATIKQASADLLKDLLKAQPKAVAFGKIEMPSLEGAPVSFAAPAGIEVDPGGLEKLAKAQAHLRANPKSTFLEAVKAVS